MKLALAVLSLALAPAALAVETTPAEVLQAIDNICGDTWCEGDFNMTFKSIKLAGDKITLSFDLFLYSDAEDERRFPQRCTIRGFSSLDETIERHGDGYVTLNDRFYEAVGSCIHRQSGKVQRQLDTMVTPEVKRTACETVYASHFGYGYDDTTFAAVCKKSNVFVTSLNPRGTEFLLRGNAASGELHICTLQMPQGSSQMKITECESH